MRFILGTIVSFVTVNVIFYLRRNYYLQKLQSPFVWQDESEIIKRKHALA